MMVDAAMNRCCSTRRRTPARMRFVRSGQRSLSPCSMRVASSTRTATPCSTRLRRPCLRLDADGLCSLPRSDGGGCVYTKGNFACTDCTFDKCITAAGVRAASFPAHRCPRRRD